MLDVVMPVMDGVEAYEKIRSMAPGCPVLFATGYGEASIPTDYLTAQGIEPLHKPYERHELLAHVRAALDSAAAAR